MTTIGQQARTAARTTTSLPAQRTFAMTVVSIAHAALVAAMVYLFAGFVLATEDMPPAAVLVFLVFITTFAVIGILTLVWTGARRRAWFWLLAGGPALLFLVMNLNYLTYDIAHPASTTPFLVTIVATPAMLAIIIGAVVAFLDVRRGRSTWSRTGPAGSVITALIAAIVGAAATSWLAGAAASGSGGGVAAAPTSTGLVTAANTTFAETSFVMNVDEVLGLFVTNEDSFGHSFDIDSLGIHVELPANSTTALAIRPSGPGSLEFYCAVPGHKAAGMAGAIVVN